MKEQNKMKKLMIAAAAFCAVFAANANQVKWSYGGYVFDGSGDNSRGGTASGTVYFFDSAAYSRTKLLEALVEAGSTTGFASILDANDLNHYGLTSTAKFNNGAYTDSDSSVSSDKLTSYFAIIAGDKIYLSDEYTANGITSGTYTQYEVKFTTDNNQGMSKSTVRNLASAGVTSTNGGAGWYTAVPEPTSGLLLVLGLGALALRRRRA